MKKNDPLVAAAEAILESVKGIGHWNSFMEEKKPPVSNCLQGLKVGDEVFCFDEDECEITIDTVVHVSGGVGYIVSQADSRSAPSLQVVHDDYRRSRLEAAYHYWEEIAARAEALEEEVKSSKAALKRLKEALSIVPLSARSGLSC